MSISILVISLIFALIEAGLSWLFLGFKPVAAAVAALPLWAVTGLIFAIGMVLTFVIIILVGSMNVSDRAATFVRDHFGRTVLLAVLSIIAVLVVSIGGEMLYQADMLPKERSTDVIFLLDYSDKMALPEPEEEEEPEPVEIGSADICFVLDYSYSMEGDREQNMEAAFADAINSMADGQRVSVYRFGSSDNRLLYDWTVLSSGNRYSIISTVQAEKADDGTNFKRAIEGAGSQVEKVIGDGRTIVVVMISDGEDYNFGTVASNAPVITQNHIPIHTIFVGSGSDKASLDTISAETGGMSLISGGDLASLSTVMIQASTVEVEPVEPPVPADETMRQVMDEVLMGMSPDPRVSVVKFADTADVLYDEARLDDTRRAEISRAIQDEPLGGAPSYATAISTADQLVRKSLKEGHDPIVVVVSCGADEGFAGIASASPAIMQNSIPVHTLYLDSQQGDPDNLSPLSGETGGQEFSDSNDVIAMIQSAADANAAQNAVIREKAEDTLLTERWVRRKRVIDARILRIAVLFLLGFFFKLIAVICIGNNDRSIVTHLLHAFLIGIISAVVVEFGYSLGLPMLLILGVYWVLMITQIVRTDR